MYEVHVADNTQILHLNVVVSLMKTIVMETKDSTTSHIFSTYYSRGKNQGICFKNGSGRSVNLYCHHVDSSINGLFGMAREVNENDVTGPYTEIDFSDDYLRAAQSVMTYLVEGVVR